MANNIYYGKEKSYQLEKRYREGGEGFVFDVANDKEHLIKIYKKPKNKELENKIIFMVNNPPVGPAKDDIAWPSDVIYDSYDHFLGFVMPKLNVDKSLQDAYAVNFSRAPTFSIEQKVIIAINICKVVQCVHNYGYIIGDFNPSNIGINSQNGHVAFFDTDSYHFEDPDSKTFFRCNVAFDGCWAPELIKRVVNGHSFSTLPLPTFTNETDNFALAVHIFRLLMNGYHPFNGIPMTANASTTSPGLGNSAIAKNNYCFKNGLKPLSALTPDIKYFPSFIKELFDRAFILGDKDPYQRPTAEEWLNALLEFRSGLIQCSQNPYHFYYHDKKSENTSCPYCDAENRNYAQTGQISFSTPIVVPIPVVKPINRSSTNHQHRNTSTTNTRNTNAQRRTNNNNTTNQNSPKNQTKPNSQTKKANPQTPKNNQNQVKQQTSNTKNKKNNERIKKIFDAIGDFLTSIFNRTTATIGVILLFVVGIPVLAIGLPHYFSAQEKKGYESSNFEIKILSKESVSCDYYNYNFKSKFTIYNKGSKNATYLKGRIKFQNSYYVDLAEFNVSFSEDFYSLCNYTLSIDYSLPTNDDKSKVLYETSYKNLSIQFKWTEIYFNSKGNMTYENEFTRIKDVGTPEVDPEYDTVANLKKAKVNDLVYFGRFEMDKNIHNGYELMTWKVLNIVDNEMLLLCNNNLINIPYSEKESYTSWADSLVRKYLNSTFLNKYFNNKEKSIIVPTHLIPTSEEQSFGAIETDDSLYIPNVAEVEGYFPVKKERACQWTGCIFGDLENDISSISLDTQETYQTFWCRNASFDKAPYQYAHVYNTYYENSLFLCNEKFDVYEGLRPMVKVTIK